MYSYTTRNHRWEVIYCRASEGRRYAYTNVTYTNCRGLDYAMSVICPVSKLAFNLAQFGKK